MSMACGILVVSVFTVFTLQQLQAKPSRMQGAVVQMLGKQQGPKFKHAISSIQHTSGADVPVSNLNLGLGRQCTHGQHTLPLMHCIMFLLAFGGALRPHAGERRFLEAPHPRRDCDELTDLIRAR